jgi:hypothetical protein
MAWMMERWTLKPEESSCHGCLGSCAEQLNGDLDQDRGGRMSRACFQVDQTSNASMFLPWHGKGEETLS